MNGPKRIPEIYFLHKQNVTKKERKGKTEREKKKWEDRRLKKIMMHVNK